jgi:hypothetical protein
MAETNSAIDLLQTDDYTVTIAPADNGFIIRQGPRVEVVEEREDYRDDAEARTSLRLLYAVLDMLGRLGSKHDKFRCVVRCVNQQTGEDATDKLD